MPNKREGMTAKTEPWNNHWVRYYCTTGSKCYCDQPGSTPRMNIQQKQSRMILSLIYARGKSMTYAVLSFFTQNPKYDHLLLQEPWLNSNKEPPFMREFQIFTPVPSNTKCVTYVRIQQAFNLLLPCVSLIAFKVWESQHLEDTRLQSHKMFKLRYIIYTLQEDCKPGPDWLKRRLECTIERGCNIETN